MDTTMARISNTIKLIAYRAINTPAIFLFCLVCWSPQAAAGVQIQQWTHSSGAKVYLGESPAIPMVDVLIEWDAGSRRDPAAQMGLAAAAANMLNKGVAAQGGAAALDENAVGEAWADLGASFNASASSDRFSASLRSLTYPDLLDKAAALAARMLSARPGTSPYGCASASAGQRESKKPTPAPPPSPTALLARRCTDATPTAMSRPKRH
jgi:hypothetical protein